MLITAHSSRNDGKSRSPTRVQEERASVHWQRPGERLGHAHISSPENSFQERKNTRPPSTTVATRISVPAPAKGPDQRYLGLFSLLFAIYIMCLCFQKTFLFGKGELKET